MNEAQRKLRVAYLRHLRRCADCYRPWGQPRRYTVLCDKARALRDTRDTIESPERLEAPNANTSTN